MCGITTILRFHHEKGEVPVKGPFQRGDLMSSDVDENHVLDGIAELMLIPLKNGDTTKVKAEITLEIDQQDGKMKVSASINAPPKNKPNRDTKSLFERRYG